MRLRTVLAGGEAQRHVRQEYVWLVERELKANREREQADRGGAAAP